MILSNITNNTDKHIYLFKLIKVINYLNKLKKLNPSISLYSKQANKLTFFENELKTISIKQNMVSYIINIILTPANTVVNITDINGNVIISISAGLIKLTKFQKKSQPTALLNIFKILLAKSKFLQNKAVALHFKNVKRFHELFFITALKNKIFIKSFQSYNLAPHNGCRPKKIKRIKRRTKRLVLR